MAEIPNNPSDTASGRSFILFVAALVLLAAGVWAVAQAAKPPAPRFLCDALSVPFQPQFNGRVWTWLEQIPGKPSRLLQGATGGPVEVAPNATAFDSSPESVVWAAPEGSGSVVLMRKGGEPRELHRASRPVGAFEIAGDTVFWLQTQPGVDSGSPLPPLADTVELWAIAASGGEPRRIAAVMESEAGGILGVRGDEVFFSAIRPGTPGSMAVYSASMETGKSARVAGDSGRGSAVMTDSGEICWSAPSRESSEPIIDTCLRCRRPDGQVSTRADWLFAGGQMAVSGDQAFYLDADMNSAAWSSAQGGGLPQSLPVPPNHGVAGVSGGKALTFLRVPSGVKLYEAELP